ncbi:homoserine dehydrogenase [Halalkalibacterium halodurans]|jgi:homoserine dehydrogenase|nr:homoserine dehydrogenase [Halalkalibacterium halodurans]MDY7221778.1 homoserine dehydrogenase [Halalkalibacterium halodurans]MDY7241054.1 homoserine dehydrogenase [Halalkalibacterium halodurans]MED4081897.1 homoserine dehydrogenase [Halalkalibacterium halodurans]MED4086023.1 homoserine dehydrogenase [Halalkalibacterium halodurans]MED4107128.1 homoserine dehydrogenase [Halalkalibacterium halodurans]
MIKVGVIGFGTVGQGVVESLVQLERGLRKEVTLEMLLVTNRRKHEHSEQYALVTDDWKTFAARHYDVVFEAAGGIEPVYDYVRFFLKKGVPVVTANKKLVAERGEELERLAAENDTYLCYEAAVAGGIPILNAIKGTLATTSFTSVAGILNGTTNYILTGMIEQNRPFQDMLEEAQAKGYAEADPTDDIEGYDAWYKIRILARLCFGIWPNRDDISRSGLHDVLDWHVELGQSLGLTLKLDGRASVKNNTIIGSVAPAFFTNDHPFSTVYGVTNAVVLEGKAIERLLFTGPGAGKEATANSMVEDYLFHERYKGERQPMLIKEKEQNRIANVLVMVAAHEKKEAEKVVEHLPCQRINTFAADEGEAWWLKVYEDVIPFISKQLGLSLYRVYGAFEKQLVTTNMHHPSSIDETLEQKA